MNSTQHVIFKLRGLVRREETLLRYPGHGDNWHMTWAANDLQYVALCDGAGLTPDQKSYFNSRLFTISGDPYAARFHDVEKYPTLAPPTQGRTAPRYYGLGTLALDSYIYQFLSTFNRTMSSDDLETSHHTNLTRFNGAKLIYSPDQGKTWCNQDGSTPVVWENWHQRSRQTLVFFEEEQECFSLLSILQMGKNYAHNLDGFVYVYAPNGNTEGTMNELVMFRVKKTCILNRNCYEYFAGRGAASRPIWTGDIRDRAVVHTFPSGWVNTRVHPYAWQPSVVYNPALNVYMMTSWGMGKASDGSWFGRPSYLGFWIAEHPWGPWIQFHEETSWLPAADTKARCYQPQIAPKWIAPDGRSFWLVWTDFQGADSAELQQWWKEYFRRTQANTQTESDVIDNVAMSRKHMPNYTFNLQRIDLAP